MNKTSFHISIIIAAVIIVGGGSFYAGMQYQKSQVPAFDRANFRAGGGFGNGITGALRTRTGGGQTVGEILKMDDTSITVKMADDSSKIVILSDATRIVKADQVSKSELKVGERVGVFGRTNADGSITAQNIQLNPMQREPNGATPIGAK